MLNKYVDSILIFLGLAAIAQFYLLFNLSRDNNKLKKINKELLDLVGIFNQGNGAARSTNSRVLTVIQSNAEDIKNLKKQMGQVHKWLGDVLGISNLIPNKEEGIDATFIIEELQQRVEWAKELERRQINEEEFYKGD